MMLFHDKPANADITNGLKRARLLTDLAYTPVKRMAASDVVFPDGKARDFVPSWFKAGFPVKGAVYSSVVRTQKFIGYNISVETFLTAVRDGNSILYTKDHAYGVRNNSAAVYGTVCSEFVSFVWNLPASYPTSRWHLIPGNRCLGQPPLEELKLLDSLLNATHVTVITDIVRDDDGRVVSIEVSESSMPRCRRTRFTPEQFLLAWYGNEKPYRVWRLPEYSISYEPLAIAPQKWEEERGVESDPVLPAYRYNTVLCPDRGNRANYLASEPVMLDFLEEGWDMACVTPENGETFSVPVSEGKAVLPELKPGFYSACGVKADGTKSDDVFWCVCAFEDAGMPAVVHAGDTVKVHIRTAACDPVIRYSFILLSNEGAVCTGFFPGEESISGEAFLGIPAAGAPGACAPGDYVLLLTAKNRYGEYASGEFPFTVA